LKTVKVRFYLQGTEVGVYSFPHDTMIHATLPMSFIGADEFKIIIDDDDLKKYKQMTDGKEAETAVLPAQEPAKLTPTSVRRKG
jgi:hypothetical protein